MTNLIFAGVLLVFGMIYFRASTQIPSNMLEDPVGASGFPKLLGVVIIGLAVVLIGQVFMGVKRQIFPRGNRSDVAITTAFRRFQPTLLLFVTLVVFLTVLDTLGYWLSVSFMLLAIFIQSGLRTGWVPVLVAVLGAAGFQLIFGKLLGVQLPAGILPGLFP